LANKRIFELAKELGVKSKSIVEKCHAEGIPKDVIKNHMSTISVGLEQTVREWFASESGEESPHTSVEESDRVDLEKVKETRRRRARAAKPGGDQDGDSGADDGSVATATQTPPPPPAARAVSPGRDASAPTAAPEAPSVTPAPAPPEPPEPEERPAAAAAPNAGPNAGGAPTKDAG